jgi:hypothetical protein
MGRRILAFVAVAVVVAIGIAIGVAIGRNSSSEGVKGVTTTVVNKPPTKTTKGHKPRRDRGGHKNLSGTYTSHNETFKCRGKVAPGTTVNVVIDNGSHTDGVHIDDGCTGGPLIVHIRTNGADGVKVHKGAHDLVVKGGVRCAGKHGSVHQDGVQAMGGMRITFEGFNVHCPTGNNGGFWVNAGRNKRSIPTDIICDHCDLFERNAALHVGPNSIRSGARNSRLHHGTSRSSPPNCARIDRSAEAPVSSNNTCVAPPTGT